MLKIHEQTLTALTAATRDRLLAILNMMSRVDNEPQERLFWSCEVGQWQTGVVGGSFTACGASSSRAVMRRGIVLKRGGQGLATLALRHYLPLCNLGTRPSPTPDRHETPLYLPLVRSHLGTGHGKIQPKISAVTYLHTYRQTRNPAPHDQNN
jgi:hypothetical protein